MHKEEWEWKDMCGASGNGGIGVKAGKKNLIGHRRVDDRLTESNCQ